MGKALCLCCFSLPVVHHRVLAALLLLALGEGSTVPACLEGVVARGDECSKRHLGRNSRRAQLCPEPGEASALHLPIPCSSTPAFCSDQNYAYVSLYFKQRHERKTFPELGAEGDVSEDALNAGNKVV